MEGTVRQRAYQIEGEARRFDPATAVNVLSVRLAQSEAREIEWKRQLDELGARYAALLTERDTARAELDSLVRSSADLRRCRNGVCEHAPDGGNHPDTADGPVG